MGNAFHMKPWPRWAQALCSRLLGHQDRNYSDGNLHYAYCLRCGYLFGNPWGDVEKLLPWPKDGDPVFALRSASGAPKTSHCTNEEAQAAIFDVLHGQVAFLKDALEQYAMIATPMGDIARTALASYELPQAHSEPPVELLVSMALRVNHGFGLDDARSQEVQLADMRKVYEEVTGHGFYRAERKAYYAGLIRTADSRDADNGESNTPKDPKRA